MGLFDDDEEISVASTLYNLAGDEDERPNFLKSTLFAGIMANSESLGDEIVGSYLNGPGIKLRQFFNYCKRNDFFGLPYATFRQSLVLDPDDVKTAITIPSTPTGLSLSVTSARVNDGSFDMFAEQYIMNNMYSRILDDWVASYDVDTNTITIQFGNGDIETFNPVDYSSKSTYITAKYYYFFADQTADWVVGSVVSVSALPDLTGWTENSSTSTFTPTPLVRTADVVISYNNGDPDEYDSYDASTTGELSTAESEYEGTFYVSDNGNQVVWSHEKYFFTATDYITDDYVEVIVEEEDLGGGVIKTTTTTITGEQITARWDQQHDTQEIIEGEIYEHERTFIYKIGSGNATLDALVTEASEEGWEEFFPYMPIRLKNKSILHEDYEDMYADIKKAYRRATDKPFADLVEAVEDNDDIDDIDYATVVYGVSLNVKENSARKYLFSFFDQQFAAQTNPNAIAEFQADLAQYEADMAALEEYEATDWENTHYISRPPPPPVPSAPSLPQRSLVVRTDGEGRVDNFDLRTYWTQIDREFNTGTFTFIDPDTLVSRDSKLNDCMLTNGASITYQVRDGYTQTGTGDNATETVRYRTVSIPSTKIYLQTGDDSYTVITVYGLAHKNVIYDGESVKITAKEALNDDDPSGFIIPLHYPTLIAMGIKDYTQISTACVHILFNSYEVVTTKWYEKGIFRILLVILVIVIAVIVFPGAFAGGGGLLGGNLAIGTAAGLTGTAALVVGVVANYLAAIVVSQLLSTFAAEAFGPKWGALVSALLGFALGFAMGGFQFDLKTLFNLTNALANGYAGYMQGEAQEIYAEAADEAKKYEKEMEKIQKMIDDLLGGNDLNFNPLFLTDTAYGNEPDRVGSYQPETADQFIQRTMLTGSDIVDISKTLVYDHASISLTLPKPQGS